MNEINEKVAYEEASLEVIEFVAADIITASAGEDETSAGV